jgi:hypothetical protein
MNDIWTYQGLRNSTQLKNNLLSEIYLAEYQKFNTITKSDYLPENYDGKMNVLKDRKYFWDLQSACSLKKCDFYTIFTKKYCVKTSKITNFWFQQYTNNDLHDWHYHGDSNISFIYYVELPDSKYSTEFFDIESREIFKPEVSEGDIIVFPSHIPHRSPRIESNTRKTIISWNMSLEDVDTNLMT